MSGQNPTCTLSEDVNYVKFKAPRSSVNGHNYESIELRDNSTGMKSPSCEIPTVRQSGTNTDVGDEILARGGDIAEPQGSAQTQEDSSFERLYYTLPRKKTGLLRRFSRKPPRTVAEIGVQVAEASDDTPQEQLQKFMTGVSAQILQLRELCAKQERLENLGHKISDLVDLNRNMSETLSSNVSAQNLLIAYTEAKDELDHVKLKLEESFHENDVISRRLLEKEEELGSVARERDDVRFELETSMSKTKDLELNSSMLLEENDDVKDKLEQEKVALSTMSENLEEALNKRDKYKRLFVKLKVNSSLIVDHYINELNLALYDNRQVLMNAIRGGPRDLKEVGRQIDNFLHIQQENNRLADQVEYLSAQLTIADILTDELTEQMDHMTQLLGEYKKAGIKPPTLKAQHLQKQVDRYSMLMKNKEQYFADRKATLLEKLSKAKNKGDHPNKSTEATPAKENVDAEVNKTNDENSKSTEATTLKVEYLNTNPNKAMVDDRASEENLSRPKPVTSHGDTPGINISTDSPQKLLKKKKKKKFFKLRQASKGNNFPVSDKKIVESTQSMPNINNNSLMDRNSAADSRQCNFF